MSEGKQEREEGRWMGGRDEWMKREWCHLWLFS